jgi:hypothetical protein
MNNLREQAQHSNLVLRDEGSIVPLYRDKKSILDTMPHNTDHKHDPKIKKRFDIQASIIRMTYKLHLHSKPHSHSDFLPASDGGCQRWRLPVAIRTDVVPFEKLQPSCGSSRDHDDDVENVKRDEVEIHHGDVHACMKPPVATTVVQVAVTRACSRSQTNRATNDCPFTLANVK